MAYSGNPIDDYIDYCESQKRLERLEETRIKTQHECLFCKGTFRDDEGGLEFDFEKACKTCIENGTVRRYFLENGMSNSLIDRTFIHATKLESE